MAHRSFARVRRIDIDEADTPEGTFSQSDPKPRHCLRCRSEFRSEWAGERVCPKCKGSSSWRSGQPTAATTSRR